jgi:hypothetical protein
MCLGYSLKTSSTKCYRYNQPELAGNSTSFHWCTGDEFSFKTTFIQEV